MLVTAYSRMGEKVLIPQAALANPLLNQMYSVQKPDVRHLEELEQYAATQTAFTELVEAAPAVAESKSNNNRATKAQKTKE